MKSWESCEIDCAENEGEDKDVLSNTDHYIAVEDKDI